MAKTELYSQAQLVMYSWKWFMDRPYIHISDGKASLKAVVTTTEAQRIMGVAEYFELKFYYYADCEDRGFTVIEIPLYPNDIVNMAMMVDHVLVNKRIVRFFENTQISQEKQFCFRIDDDDMGQLQFGCVNEYRECVREAFQRIKNQEEYLEQAQANWEIIILD